MRKEDPAARRAERPARKNLPGQGASDGDQVRTPTVPGTASSAVVAIAPSGCAPAYTHAVFTQRYSAPHRSRMVDPIEIGPVAGKISGIGRSR